MSSPYQSPDEMFGAEPAPRASSGNKLLLILLGGGGLILMLACCGGIGGVVMFGLNLMSEDIKRELRDNPQFQQHIGEVEEFSLDFVASAADEADDVWVFHVKGSIGQGEVTLEAVTNDDGGEDILWAKLRLPSGETVVLVEE